MMYFLDTLSGTLINLNVTAFIFQSKSFLFEIIKISLGKLVGLRYYYHETW